MLESLYAPNTDFRTWSWEHWAILTFGALLTAYWLYKGRRAATPEAQQRIALNMSLVGVIAWLYADVVMFLTHQAPMQSILPFHLCYFLNLLFPYMLYKRKIAWFDWLYPIVMAGCLQALFTPDLEEIFPHYYSIRYWVVHLGLIQSMLYAIVVYGFRPSWQGIFKCAVFLNVYALCMIPINWLLDTNFLYLRHPAPGSIMTKLGPWPEYLYGLEVLMLVLFTVVYLPWLWVHLRQKTNVSA
jgi:hypothetical integral membrane protein (TIGR02206 family)